MSGLNRLVYYDVKACPTANPQGRVGQNIDVWDRMEKEGLSIKNIQVRGRTKDLIDDSTCSRCVLQSMD